MLSIGVIGTANIAERKMIPAILKKPDSFRYVGASISTKEECGFVGNDKEFEEILLLKQEKAKRFISLFGGKTYSSYESLIDDNDVDAVYIALPPALHYKWASLAIAKGKHIIVEKPFTTNINDSIKLIEEAKKNNVSVIENYGFVYHKQMEIIENCLKDGCIGELRLIRCSFGFPHRDYSDFRYKKEMGGGALFDCGGYTVKASTFLLGNELNITSSNSVITPNHEVDIFGCATLMRDDGVCSQISYGMDNYYKCELEIWGEKGLIFCPRIFTAPNDFESSVIIKNNYGEYEKKAVDDQFLKTLNCFEKCVYDNEMRLAIMDEILLQSKLVNEISNSSVLKN